MMRAEWGSSRRCGWLIAWRARCRAVLSERFDGKTEGKVEFVSDRRASSW